MRNSLIALLVFGHPSIEALRAELMRNGELRQVCVFPLLAPVLVAVAYEKLTQNQETDWDFAQDVLVTHGPPGVIKATTGACGLAAMLWLYGVAWHQPMAESIGWARATVSDAFPSFAEIKGGLVADGGLISNLSLPSVPSFGAAASGSASAPGPPPGAPIDPELDRQFAERRAREFAERRARVNAMRSEGPRI